MDAFLNTPEMSDWEDFVAAARRQLETGADTVTVPVAFLRRVIDDIATSPLMFVAVREDWNRHCDSHGQPAFKERGGRAEDDDDNGDGPF
ncbi:hypothetical protein [Rhodopila sp.]|jgi:hypothetical protein|uniref:hypothetical protein n=1 Tax=Rhodopila sp. TaxID=2480087 RepID=UPI002B998155|nr:hypothetical protein [Rhodopila sp.]HVZ10138.1 hypothetical protein [Rhodopila sp.]